GTGRAHHAARHARNGVRAQGLDACHLSGRRQERGTGNAATGVRQSVFGAVPPVHGQPPGAQQGAGSIMIIKVVAAAAMAAVMAVSGAQAQETLKIGSEGAYPPFNAKDANGDLIGFDIDIANALCAEMKVECTLVTQDWDGMIPALQNKKFDAIVASMSITEERLKAVSFTDPYYSNKLQYVAKKGADLDITADALKGKAVGAQR